MNIKGSDMQNIEERLFVKFYAPFRIQNATRISLYDDAFSTSEDVWRGINDDRSSYNEEHDRGLLIVVPDSILFVVFCLE
jgi:hypothetical protein